MLPDRVSNPGPLTYESGALPTALRGPASLGINKGFVCREETGVTKLFPFAKIAKKYGCTHIHLYFFLFLKKKKVLKDLISHVQLRNMKKAYLHLECGEYPTTIYYSLVLTQVLPNVYISGKLKCHSK